ncbi:hypothetical protein Tco_1228273 [Tanacetum coccineum]
MDPDPGRGMSAPIDLSNGKRPNEPDITEFISAIATRNDACYSQNDLTDGNGFLQNLAKDESEVNQMKKVVAALEKMNRHAVKISKVDHITYVYHVYALVAMNDCMQQGTGITQ